MAGDILREITVQASSQNDRTRCFVLTLSSGPTCQNDLRDIAALTREAADSSGIPYLVEVDSQQVDEILTA